MNYKISSSSSKMQHLYTRLFIAQLFFAIVLFSTPSYVKASASLNREPKPIFAGPAHQFKPIELPAGISIEDLPVFTKVIDSQYW